MFGTPHAASLTGSSYWPEPPQVVDVAAAEVVVVDVIVGDGSIVRKLEKNLDV